MQGFYGVIEGCDGTGKSTIIKGVKKKLQDKYSNGSIKESEGMKTARRYSVESYYQPGCTELGHKLRKLIKYSGVPIEEFTRQMLYMADASQFIHEKLSNIDDRIVLCDRATHISSIVYSYVDKVPIENIVKLFNIVKSPRINRLYIIVSDSKRCYERANKRSFFDKLINGSDHFDNMKLDFYNEITSAYQHIHTLSPEISKLLNKIIGIKDIIYINNDGNPNDAIDTIFNDIVSVLDSQS